MANLEHKEKEASRKYKKTSIEKSNEERINQAYRECLKCWKNQIKPENQHAN